MEQITKDYYLKVTYTGDPAPANVGNVETTISAGVSSAFTGWGPKTLVTVEVLRCKPQTIPAEELKAIEGLIPDLYLSDDTSFIKMRITQACMAVGKATYLRSLEREKQAAKGPRWVKGVDRLPKRSGKYPIKKINGEFAIGNFHAYEKKPSMYDTFYLSPESYEWLEEGPPAGDNGAEGGNRFPAAPISLLTELRQKSVQRAKIGFKTYENVPITYWTTALAGEVGELCNMIKKMERVANGGIDGGSSYTAASLTSDDLKEEIGGIAIYLDILASLLKIDLAEAIIETFNSKSEKYGFQEKLGECAVALPLQDWLEQQKEIAQKLWENAQLWQNGATMEYFKGYKEALVAMENVYSASQVSKQIT